MSQHKTKKKGIVYFRLLKNEAAPAGFDHFKVLMKNPINNFQMQPHFIAAASREEAASVVAEDYQTEGHGYLAPEISKVVGIARHDQPNR